MDVESPVAAAGTGGSGQPAEYETIFNSILDIVNAAHDPTPQLPIVSKAIADLIEGKAESPAYSTYLTETYLPKLTRALLKWKYPYNDNSYRINEFLQSVLDYVIHFLPRDSAGAVDAVRRIFDGNRPFFNYFQREHPHAEDHLDAEGERYARLPRTRNAVFGSRLFVANVNYFTQHGGFRVLLDRLKQPSPRFPLAMMVGVVTTIAQIQNEDYLIPEKLAEIMKELQPIVCDYIRTMSDEELRAASDDDLTQLIVDLQELLEGCLSEGDAGRVGETLYLEVALRCFRSTNLKKRMHGLSCIKEAISMVHRAQYSMRNRGVQYRSAKWLTHRTLQEWIRSNDILESLVGATKHAELLKISCDVFRFVCKAGDLKESDLDALWQCAVSSHEIYTAAIFNEILSPLHGSLSEEQIAHLFKKMESRPRNQIDVHMLEFAKSLMQRKSPSLLPLLQWMGSLVMDDGPACPAIELCMDVLTCSAEAWKSFYVAPFKESTMATLVQAIMENRSIYFGLRLLTAIIATYPDYRAHGCRMTHRQVVNWLHKQYDIVGVLVSNFSVFKAVARHAFEALTPEDRAGNINTMVLSGRTSYLAEILERLKFMRMIISQTDAILSPSQCDSMWDNLVEGALAAGEADALCRWFVDQLSPGRCYVLDDGGTRHLLMNCLLRQDPATLSISGFRCFQRYFIYVAVQDNNLAWLSHDGGEGVGAQAQQQQQQGSFDFEVTKVDEIPLTHYVWEVVLKNQAMDVVLEATDLLVRLYESPCNSIRDSKPALQSLRMRALDVIFGHLMQAGDDVTRIERCLAVLKALFAKCESDGGVRPPSHGLSARGRPLVICFTNTIQSAQPPESFTMNAHSNETLREIRERCLKMLPLVKAADSLIFRSLGQELTDLNKTLQDMQFEDKQAISISSSKEGLLAAQAVAKAAPRPGPQVFHDDPAEADALAQQLVAMCECSAPVALAALRRMHWDISEAVILLLDPVQLALLERDVPVETPTSQAPAAAGAVDEELYTLYPSMLLASNQRYIDHLFTLLTECKPVASQVWDLLMAIPTNGPVLKELHELTFLEAVSPTAAMGWGGLFNTESSYRLLYSLQIIDTLLFPMNDDDNVKQRVSWGYKFLHYGGFQHLFHILVSEAFAPTSEALSVQRTSCLALLLKIIEFFMRGALSKPHDSPSEGRADGSRPSEFDTLIQKIAAEMSGTLLESVSLPELVARLLALTHAAAVRKEIGKDEGDVVAYAMRLMVLCVLGHAALFREVVSYPRGVPTLVREVVMECKEKSIRAEASESLYRLCSGVKAVPAEGVPTPHTFLKDLLLKELPGTDDKSAKLAQYFHLLCRIVEDACQGCEGSKAEDFQTVLGRVVEAIKLRRTVEVDSKERDEVLIGFLRLARTVLSYLPPMYRLRVGSRHEGCLGLVNDVYSTCLFATAAPGDSHKSGTPLPPKCKSPRAREAAFSLLVELCRDCPQNTAEMLEYLAPHHTGTVSVAGWDYYPGADARSATGYVGLQNMGCTCYVNSLLQQMYMMPRLRRGFLTIEEGGGEGGKKDRADNVVWQIQTIMGYLQEAAKKAYVPDGFMKAYKDWEGQPINVIVQQDVDEFFNLLCQRVEEHLKGSPQATLLASQFGGKLSNVIRSLEPEFPYYGENPEDFFRISLDIKGKANVTEALDSFCKADIMEGDNAYQCEEFSRKISASKGYMIHSMSDNLILHLKRFEFDLHTMERTKVHDHLTFPSRLNMLPWTREGMARKRKDTDKTAANEKELPLRPDWYYQYELAGVLVHQGEAQGGHYYSYIRKHSQPMSDADLAAAMEEMKLEGSPEKFPGQWFEFNDSEVTPFNPDRIQQECFGGQQIITTWLPYYRRHQEKRVPRTRSAYMLFYKRMVPAPPGWEDPLAPPPPAEDSTAQRFNELSMSEKMPPVDASITAVSDTATNKDVLAQITTLTEKVAQIRPSLEDSQSIDAEPCATDIPPPIYEAVWRENLNFTRDRYLFDAEYFGFMLAFAKSVPFEDVPTLLHDTADDRGYAVLTLGTSFCFEVLIHARVNDLLAPWFEFLIAGVSRHVPAARWCLEYCTRWIKETLLECPREDVRHFVCGLMCAAMRTCAPHERDLYDQFEEMPLSGTPTAAGSPGVPAVQHQRAAVAMRFLDRIFELMEQSRVYWRHFKHYWRIYSEFATLGWRERRILIDHNLYELFVDYYMGNNARGATTQRVMIMDGHEFPDLTHFMESMRIVTCGCQIDPHKSCPPRTTITASALEPGCVTVCIMPDHARRHFFRIDFWESMVAMGYNPESTCQMMWHIIWEDVERSRWLIRLLNHTLSASIHKSEGIRLPAIFDSMRSVLVYEDSLQDERAFLALTAELHGDPYHMGVFSVLRDWARYPRNTNVVLQGIRWIVHSSQEIPSVAKFLDRPDQRKQLQWVADFLSRHLNRHKATRRSHGPEPPPLEREDSTFQALATIDDILRRGEPDVATGGARDEPPPTPERVDHHGAMHGAQYMDVEEGPDERIDRRRSTYDDEDEENY